MDFSEIESKEYELIGRKFVDILLANLDFAETKTRLSEPEILLDLKKLLENQYLDGITGISAFIDETEKITGIFEDKVSEQVTKRYAFKVSNEAISYKLLNTDQLQEADFSEDELNFTEKKGKTCVKGTRCGSACISASKTCRLDMTTEQRKVHETILRKVGKVDSSLAKKRREKKFARGGALAQSTLKQKERLAQAKAAKEKFDIAQAKADLANRYYGKSVNGQDAVVLGLTQGETLRFNQLQSIRKERDAVKAELDKFGSGIKYNEKFKPGRPLSDTQINKPLSQEEINKLGSISKLPDPRAYASGSNQQLAAIELGKAYSEAKKEIPELTVPEFRIIRSYTKGSHFTDSEGITHGYILPNASARGLMKNPNSDIAKAGVTQARLVHSALGKLPDWQGEVRRDTTLPRSQFEQEYQIGKKVRFNGVTSTTSDLSGKATEAYGVKGKQKTGVLSKASSKASKYDDIANELGIKSISSDDSIQIEYRMKVKSGKNISKLSAAPKESEIALRHGTTLSIRQVERLDGGKVKVYLEED